MSGLNNHSVKSMASGIFATTNCAELEKCKGLLTSGLSKEAKEQVTRKFPEPLSKWALEEAESAQEKGKKKAAFPVDKLHHTLKEYNPGMEKQVTLILSGVLEYMASDILNLTTDYARRISGLEIFDQDIKIAMFADNILMEVFHPDDDFEDMNAVPSLRNWYEGLNEDSYESLVREFMLDEASYLRDLNLIIKVIRKVFDAAPELFSMEDVDAIFSNIVDLAELSEVLIGLLEDAVEMTDESCPVPLVGLWFENLALECSFELYSDYTITRMSTDWQEAFERILAPSAVTYLQKVYSGFRDVVVYVLPNLLLAPIYHCFYYLEQMELLKKNSPDAEDKECFIQALSAVTPIKLVLETNTRNLRKLSPSEVSLQKSWRGNPTTERLSHIEKNIDGWWGAVISQSCKEFLHEGELQHVEKANKRYSDRHVFLFDTLLVCCKSKSTVATQYEYRLKERIIVRKAIIRDIIGDDEESKYRFEVIDGEKNESHIFHAKTVAEKQAWMSHLIRLRYRSTFNRMLDEIEREEAVNQQLRLPSPEIYRFAEPDSPENLILEELDHLSDSPCPVDFIKGGTVLKLVERLTYHKYSDPSFKKTFLTTFRSFCKPKDLLELLLERYHIPEPTPAPEQQMAINRGEIPNREDLKRFREEYLKPIQLRVMNVIRQWLEHHWYDFERDKILLAELENFIQSVRGKNMKKWAKTMQNLILRKKYCEELQPIVEFNDPPPVIQWHSTRDPAKFSLFTLHPVEIARQLTLIEFDLYRKVQPSEMVGSVWTKVGKEANSPNLLRIIHFSTKITRWVSKSLVEINNLNERQAALCRAIEVMMQMKQLNNFNGLLEFASAFGSSAVYRLKCTKKALSDHKGLKACMDMCEPRLKKMLQRLQSIDPPCVPFVGTFLTDILKTEEGNPHLLPNQPDHFQLINFSKRRRVAEIMFQVQQYQNLPYNLEVVPSIRDFFLDLDPLEGRTEKEFNDYLFHSSLKIEPRYVERPLKHETGSFRAKASPSTENQKKSTTGFISATIARSAVGNAEEERTSAIGASSNEIATNDASAATAIMSRMNDNGEVVDSENDAPEVIMYKSY